MFICDLCGYIDEESLKAHIEVHHPQTDVPAPPPPAPNAASTC